MNDTSVVRLRNDVTERDHSAGSENAPVTLLEYGNFECIDCGRTYPAIKELQRVLGDSLRFVFRHFPSVQTHAHSLRAAEAAEAAGAQGKFWEMHDELFLHQQALDDRNLLRYGHRIGLDMNRFAREMAENTFVKLIEADYEYALFNEHVTGTPTLYINSVRYTGATDAENLLTAIKQADTEGRIQGSTTVKGISRLVDGLRHLGKRNPPNS